MPAISVGVGIPGTPLRVATSIGLRSSAEKQADEATAITEAAERDRVAENAVRPAMTGLDQLMETDGLSRFR